MYIKIETVKNVIVIRNKMHKTKVQTEESNIVV